MYSGRHNRRITDAGLPHGIPIPRAARSLYAGTIAGQRGHVAIGLHNTRWLLKSDTDECVRHCEVELLFEKARRDVAPQAPSRLSSLYLAEGSEAGRLHAINSWVRTYMACGWWSRTLSARIGGALAGVTFTVPVLIRALLRITGDRLHRGLIHRHGTCLLMAKSESWIKMGSRISKNQGAHHRADTRGRFGDKP
jgi:hypothetical protein